MRPSIKIDDFLKSLSEHRLLIVTLREGIYVTFLLIQFKIVTFFESFGLNEA